MSVYLGTVPNNDFKIGETVSFDYEGHRLTGTITRIYPAGNIYQVDVEGERWEVDAVADNMRRGDK